MQLKSVILKHKMFVQKIYTVTQKKVHCKIHLYEIIESRKIYGQKISEQWVLLGLTEKGNEESFRVIPYVLIEVLVSWMHLFVKIWQVYTPNVFISLYISFI